MLSACPPSSSNLRYICIQHDFCRGGDNFPARQWTRGDRGEFFGDLCCLRIITVTQVKVFNEVASRAGVYPRPSRVQTPRCCERQRTKRIRESADGPRSRRTICHERNRKQSKERLRPLRNSQRGREREKKPRRVYSSNAIATFMTTRDIGFFDDQMTSVSPFSIVVAV